MTGERECADDGEGVASGAVAPGRTPHSRRLDNTGVVVVVDGVGVGGGQW